VKLFNKHHCLSIVFTLALVTGTSILLSSCGFRLRGAITLPESLSTIAIEGTTEHSDLGRVLYRSLKRGGVSIVSTSDAGLRLQILKDEVTMIREWLPFLNVKKGEGLKTFLMFLYFFLTITAYYILKPVRDSLFIEWMGAENLPFVYLGDALVIGLVVYVYSRFAERLEGYLLITASALFLIFNLLLL